MDARGLTVASATLIDARRRRLVGALGGGLGLATLFGGCAVLDAPATRTAGNVLQVGPNRAIRTIAQAAQRARDGDTIEIDAATYSGDVAVWTQRNLTIRGVGGRPRFDAGGRSAEGKGIFVTRGDNITVENLALANCRVPSQNGAGIRHEAGRLIVRNVHFERNENGILSGNTESISVDITDSVFRENGHGDGYSHGLYVGLSGSLRMVGCYVTGGRVGHLLKSRARDNFLAFNRFTDESGNGSYEVEVCNGGVTYLIGNVIQQVAATNNSVIVSYGVDPLRWPVNELYMAHNTVVNDRAGGVFVRTPKGSAARLVNNLFVGPGTMAFGGAAEQIDNASVGPAEFVNAGALDYRLRPGSAQIGAVKAAGMARDVSLTPTREYAHPASTREIVAPAAWSRGAFQFIAL